MSRLFAAGTDNLTSAPLASFTRWCAGGWYYPTAFTDAARLFHSDPNGAGLRGAIRFSGVLGALQAQTDCATLDADAVTTTTVTTNKWWFIAAIIDASSVLHIYIGDAATPCAEASYLSSVTGVGALTSASHFHFGNNHGGATGYTGRIARPFVHDNTGTAMTLERLRAVQFGQYSALVGPGLVGLWDTMNPTAANNPLIAGASSTLTATGVTVADEPPVPFRFAA